MRRALLLTLFPIIAAAAWAYLSPRLAAKRFRDATIAGDTKALSAVVDFPALRRHLKADLRTAAAKRGSERAGDNPVAQALGAQLGVAVSDAAVERIVSPQGLIRLARYGSTQSSASTLLLLGMGYRNLVEFGVTMGKTRGHEDVTFLFHRNGLTWRLARLDIPSLTR